MGQRVFFQAINHRAESFFGGKNHGADSFFNGKNHGAQSFFTGKNHGALTFFSPRKIRLPGPGFKRFCSLPYETLVNDKEISDEEYNLNSILLEKNLNEKRTANSLP